LSIIFHFFCLADNIEQNIVNSRDSAKAAHENLVEASEYQKAARTKMCWCALFFAIVALVLVLWLTNSF
jgi:syntaxin 7